MMKTATNNTTNDKLFSEHAQNPDFIFPDYSNSILNLSSTLLEYLGLDNGSPKIDSLCSELKKSYRNVVFIICDGLGTQILNDHKAKYLLKHTKHSLTSVFPSTTTNATTTLMTSLAPAEHAWFAWQQLFAADSKNSKIAELYTNKEYYTGQDLGTDFAFKKLPYHAFYLQKGLNPDIKIHTCFPSFVMKGVAPDNIYHSNTDDDFFEKISKLCSAKGKNFVYSYRSDLDHAMHSLGTNSKPIQKMVKSFQSGLKKCAGRNPDTLFIVTADHGHVDVSECVEIYRDKELMSTLRYPLTLEPRATAFFVKPKCHDKFKKAFKKYADDFELFESADLISRGVFGTFKNKNHKSFLGDFIAAGKSTNKILLFAETSPRFLGHHTGLTPAEMLVPLIMVGKK